MSSESTVVAVGDILVLRDDPASMFAHTRDILSSADIAFGQLETPYSDRGSRGSSGPRGAVAHDPKNRPALAGAGFDVISIASNHTGDWGADALLDCIENLGRDGIVAIGAGANIAQARKPAVVQSNGRRIAFLAYCSVAPEGYYAASTKPGCAPMRAITHYEPFEPDQPGTPARIMTYPRSADLDALVSDIERAKEQADYLAVSMHWGVHGLRGVIADYQHVVAHAIIDAGADIIFGHHPHVLKGIEVYRGKTIFYSLGNFAMDTATPQMLATINSDWVAEASAFYEAVEGHGGGKSSKQRVDEVEDLEGVGSSFRLSHKRTIIATWSIGDEGVEQVSFIPCTINDMNEPVPVDPASAEGRDIMNHVQEVTDEAGFDTAYSVDGSRVAVGSTQGAYEPAATASA